MSQLAQQQSQNPQVKQFAEQMIKDHQKLIQQLQQIAGTQSDRDGSRSTATPDTSLGTSSTRRSRTCSAWLARMSPRAHGLLDATTLGATGRAAGNAAVQQIASIEPTNHGSLHASRQGRAAAEIGAEFDKCYVGIAIGGHMQCCSRARSAWPSNPKVSWQQVAQRSAANRAEAPGSCEATDEAARRSGRQRRQPRRRTADLALLTLVELVKQQRCIAARRADAVNKNSPGWDRRLAANRPGLFLTIEFAGYTGEPQFNFNYAQVPQQTGVLLKQM